MRSVHFYNKNAVCFLIEIPVARFSKLLRILKEASKFHLITFLFVQRIFFLFIIDTNWKFLLKLKTSYEPA